MQRIYIVGGSGAGKSTLARRLAKELNLPHTELDALHWQADWVELELELFRQTVSDAVQNESWVIEGNYRKVQDIILKRADTLIWLDYSLAQLYRHLLPRTLRRIFKREALWNGNRETFRAQFLSQESLLLYVYKAYGRNREHYQKIVAGQVSFEVLRFKTPQELERWLESL